MTARHPDPLDRRARAAAACLLIAVDLPKLGDEWGRLMVVVEKACPSVTMAEIGPCRSRRSQLLRARALIDEMLAEGEG